MSVFEAVVLGAVQGLTEFIPISSSGHLVLVPEVAGWEHPGLAFDVLLHTASLVALLIYFRREIVDLVRGFFTGDASARRMALLLLIGTIPAAVAGLAFGDYFEEQFQDANAAAIQLIITALILIGAELIVRYRKPDRDVDDLDVADASVMGVGQAIAIFPGISRSGTTIAAGLARGLTRDAAARFSFLLAIPALIGATIVEVPDLGSESLGSAAAIGGFVASLVTSYAAIWGLIRYLRNNNLYPFAAYCMIAGPVFLAIT